MYHYIDDKDFLKRLRCTCSSLINELTQSINYDGLMEVRFNVVGSGGRNFVTQNESESLILDYNLNIISSKWLYIKNCKKIKEYVRKKFNEILNKHGWGNCNDSISTFTTEKRYFTDINNKTTWCIALTIITMHENKWYRLIHDSTGNTGNDKWFWNEEENSINLSKKVAKLKKDNYWEEVKTIYLRKKNMYLEQNDYNHPSFVCFIETIHEVYSNHF